MFPHCYLPGSKLWWRLVKAMVFPVVMYGCVLDCEEKLSAEKLMLFNCGVGEDS